MGSENQSIFLSILRLYETQVKKIVKVQSMMRAFLAKRNVATKLQQFRQDSSTFTIL